MGKWIKNLYAENERISKEQRELKNWLRTKGMTPKGFNRSVKKLANREVELADNRKAKRKRRNLATKAYQKRRKDAQKK